MDPVNVDASANAKILAVRNYIKTENQSSRHLGAGAGSRDSGTEPELAEQLNADISRKYVKGMCQQRNARYFDNELIQLLRR